MRRCPGKSFKVNLDTGRWADFADDIKGGDPVSLYAAIHNLKQGEAARELGRWLGIDTSVNEVDVTNKRNSQNGSAPTKP
jgi:putative DNA primase/helicase